MTAQQNKAHKYQEMMEAATAYIVEERPEITCPLDLANFIRPLLKDQDQESFWVITLDSKNRILTTHQSTVGIVNQCQAHAREVFRTAIFDNASRILISHNHPSGDPTPSSQDIAMTKQLVEAGKIIGIEVTDHIIIGKKTTTRKQDFMSFREEHLIS